MTWRQGDNMKSLNRLRFKVPSKTMVSDTAGGIANHRFAFPLSLMNVQTTSPDRERFYENYRTRNLSSSIFQTLCLEQF
jgi:hypothetical protein